jgi:hypothetical protein
VRTPPNVIQVLETFEYNEVFITDEMKSLADKYMAKKIVVDEYFDDALHIAIATVLDVDVLVSWNMTHIVNKAIIPLFKAVNVKEGYKPLNIKKPEEIM